MDFFLLQVVVRPLFPPWGRYEIVQTQKAYPPPPPPPKKKKNRYKNELIKKNNSRC